MLKSLVKKLKDGGLEFKSIGDLYKYEDNYKAPIQEQPLDLTSIMAPSIINRKNTIQSNYQTIRKTSTNLNS